MDQTFVSDEYRNRVCSAYQGEVYGEALFEAMSKRLQGTERAYKFRVLARLETETKQRLKPLVENLGGNAAEDADEAARGVSDGTNFAAVAWDDLLPVFREALAGFVVSYEQTETMGRDCDRAVLDHLTQHEKALLEFVDRELAGQADVSLDPVLDLLEQVPSRD